MGDLERLERVLLDEQDGRALALISRMIWKICWTRIGERPSDGSSSSSTLGWRHQGPPDGEHLLLAARERAALLAAPLREAREELVDVLDVLGALAAFVRV